MIIFNLKELPIIREVVSDDGKVTHSESTELIRTTSVAPDKEEISDLLFKQAEGASSATLLSGTTLMIEFLLMDEHSGDAEAFTYAVDTTDVLDKLMSAAQVPLPMALAKMCTAPKRLTFGNGRLVGVAGETSATVAQSSAVQEKAHSAMQVKVPVFLPLWMSDWLAQQPCSNSELVKEALVNHFKLEE